MTKSLGLLMSSVGFILLVSLPAQLNAQLPAPYFHDDFEDNDAQDGQPANWIPWKPFVDGSRAVEEGSYVITPPDEPPPIPGYDQSLTEIDSTPEGVWVQDASIRTLVSVTEHGNYWVGIAARHTMDEDGTNGSNIGIGLKPDGTLAVWTLTIGDFSPGQVDVLREVGTGLDPISEDIHLQVDLFGQDVRVTAWSEGDVKPERAQIQTAVFSSFAHAGALGMWDFVEVLDHDKPAAFRHFAVLPTAESPTLPGDFDDDFWLTDGDIDELSAALRDGSMNTRYDSNYDGRFDTEDRRSWVKSLQHTWYGDANLDGEFKSSDMVQVFTVGKYETEQEAGWSEGDWDGDGVFDSSDMVTAFADGGYEKGPRPDPVAVPEPGTWLLLSLAAGAVLVRRRV